MVWDPSELDSREAIAEDSGSSRLVGTGFRVLAAFVIVAV